MVLVRQWFWFSNGGPLVMGSMWFNGSLWFDGLPLFSLRGSVWIKGVVGGSVGFWFGAWIEAWVWLFVGRSMGLIVRGSSFVGFHSFNQWFLSLFSLQWSLPPCWIQWRWFVLLFLLSYTIFSLILLFVWFPRKWREKNQNWKLRY